jgi:hypothetical protein
MSDYERQIPATEKFYDNAIRTAAKEDVEILFS